MSYHGDNRKGRSRVGSQLYSIALTYFLSPSSLGHPNQGNDCTLRMRFEARINWRAKWNLCMMKCTAKRMTIRTESEKETSPTNKAILRSHQMIASLTQMRPPPVAQVTIRTSTESQGNRNASERKSPSKNERSTLVVVMTQMTTIATQAPPAKGSANTSYLNSTAKPPIFNNGGPSSGSWFTLSAN